MKVFLIVFAIILIFLAVLLFVPLGCSAFFSGASFDFKVNVFGLDFDLKSKRKKKKDDKKLNKLRKSGKLQKIFKGKSIPEVFADISAIFKLFGLTAKKVLERIKVENLNLQMLVGAPDAAEVAVRYGQVCSVVYPSLSAVLELMNVDTCKVNLSPDFTSTKVNFKMYFKLKTRLIDLLIVMFEFAKQLNIYKKRRTLK